MPFAQHFRPATWAILRCQHANLYQIDEQLFRSEQLTPDDIGIIQQYGINTLINLRFFDRDDNEENLANLPLTFIIAH